MSVPNSRLCCENPFHEILKPPSLAPAIIHRYCCKVVIHVVEVGLAQILRLHFNFFFFLMFIEIDGKYISASQASEHVRQ